MKTKLLRQIRKHFYIVIEKQKNSDGSISCIYHVYDKKRFVQDRFFDSLSTIFACIKDIYTKIPENVMKQKNYRSYIRDLKRFNNTLIK